jgi:hypothetical protein
LRAQQYRRLITGSTQNSSTTKALNRPGFAGGHLV